MEQEKRFVELLPLIQRVQVFGDHLAVHTEPGVFLLFNARYPHGSEDTDCGVEESQCPCLYLRPSLSPTGVRHGFREYRYEIMSSGSRELSSGIFSQPAFWRSGSRRHTWRMIHSP